LHEAVSRQDGDAVQWLIQHGANLNVLRTMEGGGVTPLHVAAANDAAEIAKLLIAAGADPTVRDPRWNADALGWAQYLGNDAARAVLETAVLG
jgi:ankyrin repeat protein